MRTQQSAKHTAQAAEKRVSRARRQVPGRIEVSPYFMPVEPAPGMLHSEVAVRQHGNSAKVDRRLQKRR